MDVPNYQSHQQAADHRTDQVYLYTSLKWVHNPDLLNSSMTWLGLGAHGFPAPAAAALASVAIPALRMKVGVAGSGNYGMRTHRWSNLKEDSCCFVGRGLVMIHRFVGL